MQLSDVEHDVWSRIDTATRRKDPRSLAVLGAIAEDMEQKGREWRERLAALDSSPSHGSHPRVEAGTDARSATQGSKERSPTAGDRDYSHTTPVAFLFGEERVPVRTWKELLVRFAELLRRKHGDRFDETALRQSGRKRSYFSRRPDSLKYAQELHGQGGALFAETNLNANLIVSICRNLLLDLEGDPDRLQIHVRPARSIGIAPGVKIG